MMLFISTIAPLFRSRNPCHSVSLNRAARAAVRSSDVDQRDRMVTDRPRIVTISASYGAGGTEPTITSLVSST